VSSTNTSSRLGAKRPISATAISFPFQQLLAARSVPSTEVGHRERVESTVPKNGWRCESLGNLAWLTAAPTSFTFRGRGWISTRHAVSWWFLQRSGKVFRQRNWALPSAIQLLAVIIVGVHLTPAARLRPPMYGAWGTKNVDAVAESSNIKNPTAVFPAPTLRWVDPRPGGLRPKNRKLFRFVQAIASPQKPAAVFPAAQIFAAAGPGTVPETIHSPFRNPALFNPVPAGRPRIAP